MTAKLFSFVLGAFIVVLPFMWGGEAVFGFERTVCLTVVLACGLLAVVALWAILAAARR